MWHERAEAAANGLIARAKGEDSLSAFSVPPELQQVFPALPSRIRIKLGKRRGLLIRRMNQTSESELNANETQLSPTSGSDFGVWLGRARASSCGLYRPSE